MNNITTSFLKRVFLSGMLFLHATSLFGMSSFNLFGGDSKDLRLSFLKSPDADRQKELFKRKEKLADFQNYREALLSRTKSLQEKTYDRLKSLSKDKGLVITPERAHDIEMVKLFDLREKTARETIETISEMRKVVDAHEALLRKFIGTLEHDSTQSGDEQSSHVFSWTKFKDVRRELEAERTKLRYLEEKKDSAHRDCARLKEQHALQKRQCEQRLEGVRKERAEAPSAPIRERFEIIEDLQSALNAELEVSNALLQELSEDKELLQADEYELQRYVVRQKERFLPEIKRHLKFDMRDINLAEQEIKNQQERNAQEMTVLARELAYIRRRHEEFSENKAGIEAIKVKNDVYVAEEEKIDQQLKLLTLQEKLLKAKGKFIEAQLAKKELEFFIIQIMRARSGDDSEKIVAQNIIEWSQGADQRRRQILSAIEQINDYNKENSSDIEQLSKYVEVIDSKAKGQISSAAKRTYQSITEIINVQRQAGHEISSANARHLELRREMQADIKFIIDELESDQRTLDVWQRSSKAISLAELKSAYKDASMFFYTVYQRSLYTLSPANLIHEVSHIPFSDYTKLLWFFFFMLLFVFGLRMFLLFVGQYIDRLLYIYQGQVWAVYLTIMRSFVQFFEQHGRGVGIWFFIRLHIAFDCGYVLFGGLKPLYGPYFQSLFYIGSIPFFLYMSRNLMQEVKTINQRMSFLFFTETLQEKFLLLLSSILYISAILLPLRRAFMCDLVAHADSLSSVVYGAWTLLLSIVALLFFSKQDIMRLVPSGGYIGQWLTQLVSSYYYPVFFFLIGLSILINPYVGYSNLAVYLAICVPISAVILYGLATVNGYIRHYSVILFIKEDADETDETTDRFEHAKMYYGVFIVLTFLVLATAGFVAITKIWGINYTLAQLWQGLSQDWVIGIEGTNIHIGFGGLLTICLFIVAGFVFSSLFSRFVLTRLYDVFRVEGGAQNTVSRILHYTIIFLAIVLGLHAIGLGQLLSNVGIGLALGISFGAKDLVADFFAGLWILIERPIEPGNFIQTGELRGTVKKIAVRATTIRTARNFSVVIPNRELVAKPIINWGGGYYAVGFEFNITVSYHVDAQKVKDLISQVVTNNSLVLRIPAVAVRLDEFGENGLVYFVRAFISTRRVRDQWDIASAIRIDLLRVLQEHSIGIPYPHVVLTRENAFGVTKADYQQMTQEEPE